MIYIRENHVNGFETQYERNALNEANFGSPRHGVTFSPFLCFFLDEATDFRF